MRPVPVVFLRLAFSPQLTATRQLHDSSRTNPAVHIHLRVLAAGYPHEEQVCFWMWRDRRPVSKSVSAVHGDIVTVFSRIEGVGECCYVPQRRHSVCVLLWRFPKLEVPFAVSQSVWLFGAFVGLSVSRTHFVGGV